MKPTPTKDQALRSIFRQPALLVLAVLLSVTACREEAKDDGVREAKKELVGDAKNELFSKEAFIQALQQAIRPVDTLDSVFRKNGLNLGNGLAFTYQVNGYRPIWVDERGVSKDAVGFLRELDSLRFDGLNPEDYGYARLSTACDALRSGKGDLATALQFDTACTRSYLRASRHLLLGRISPRVADDQWFHSNDSVWAAPRLLGVNLSQNGTYTPLDAFRSKLPTYALLRQAYHHYYTLSADKDFNAAKLALSTSTQNDSLTGAVIRKELPWLQPAAGDSLSAQQQLVRGFQQYYGMVPTGKADSLTRRLLSRQPDSVLTLIRANMERLRWLPRQLEPQYVLVNVPLMELMYRDNGNDAFRMRVVVGKPSRQTPALNANMANVVFSPPWGVPPTILKKEVLPGIASKGGAYLARKGLKAYNRQGKVVSVAGLSAGTLRGLSFRQAPGARNALGEVKFNLPNKWDIYLHDTPHKEDFPRRYRAKSSGCIRVERPKDFAAFILNDLEGRSFSPGRIDSIIETRRTRYETLSRKIPVHIVYLTAFEDSTGQSIRFLSDIYHRDDKLIQALAAK